MYIIKLYHDLLGLINLLRCNAWHFGTYYSTHGGVCAQRERIHRRGPVLLRMRQPTHFCVGVAADFHTGSGFDGRNGFFSVVQVKQLLPLKPETIP
ncbi:MAG TPA: hypothetical protein VF646_08170 [Cytophagales bacterium]